MVLRNRLVALVLVFTMVFSIVPYRLYANDLEDFIDDVVGGVYVEDVKTFKSRNYTGVTGGGFAFRLKNDMLNLAPISVTPPSMSVSCAGANFNAGMIAMLNLDAFEKMLSQAGASFAWGVMIGIVYSIPGIAEAFQTLQDWARKIQLLFQSPCKVGIAAGKALAQEFANLKRNEGASNAVSSGATGSFATAFENLKSAIEDNLKLVDIYMTFPYTQLEGLSLPIDLQNLIATSVGIVDIALKDESGNKIPVNSAKSVPDACGDRKIDGCIRINSYAGSNDFVRLLLDGIKPNEEIKLYQCNYQTPACTDVVFEKKKYSGTVKGIREKLSDYLDAVVSASPADIANAAGGSYVEGSITPGKLYLMFATILEGMDWKSLYDTLVSLHYLAETTTNDKRSQYLAQYQSIKKNIADMAAIMLLNKVVEVLTPAFNDMKNNALVNKNLSKGVVEEIDNALRTFEERARAMAKAREKEIVTRVNMGILFNNVLNSFRREVTIRNINK